MRQKNKTMALQYLRPPLYKIIQNPD